jgi:hypothetical protein
LMHRLILILFALVGIAVLAWQYDVSPEAHLSARSGLLDAQAEPLAHSILPERVKLSPSVQGEAPQLDASSPKPLLIGTTDYWADFVLLVQVASDELGWDMFDNGDPSLDSIQKRISRFSASHACPGLPNKKWVLEHLQPLPQALVFAFAKEVQPFLWEDWALSFLEGTGFPPQGVRLGLMYGIMSQPRGQVDLAEMQQHLFGGWPFLTGRLGRVTHPSFLALAERVLEQVPQKSALAFVEVNLAALMISARYGSDSSVRDRLDCALYRECSSLEYVHLATLLGLTSWGELDPRSVYELLLELLSVREYRWLPALYDWGKPFFERYSEGEGDMFFSILQMMKQQHISLEMSVVCRERILQGEEGQDLDFLNQVAKFIADPESEVLTHTLILPDLCRAGRFLETQVIVEEMLWAGHSAAGLSLDTLAAAILQDDWLSKKPDGERLEAMLRDLASSLPEGDSRLESIEAGLRLLSRRP